MNVDREGWTRVARSWPAAVVMVLLVAGASGCKTGTAGMKPSWWTFGGSPQDEAAKLAAAPNFEGGVEKPSSTAKPYPTTTTPQGYVLTDATKAGGVAPAVEAAAPAAVTYGVTPPQANPDPVEMATSRTAAPAADPAGPLASIAPQVGPYGGPPGEPASPATPSMVPASAAPPMQPIAQAAPASAFSAEPPQRVADARGSAAWSDPQPPAANDGSRYGAASSSRFGGGGAIDQSVPPAAAAAVLPAALDPLPASPAPFAAPSSGDPLAPPASLPASAPAAAPGSLPTSAPPRRPDPVYRPGGTSSYRPNRAILAADPAAVEPGGVRTAGFDSPAPTTR